MRIGLEVHVTLPTKSKLFCSCSNGAEDPNSAICPICMGMPGSKPMLNAEAVRLAKTVSLGLGSSISNPMSFVRKVYFYPDLPKSFQITQLDRPIGVGGKVRLWASGKSIGIRRVQIEEDPARVVRGEGYSLLDFNRSGSPLIEIVTEPDITSEAELREFVEELLSILTYSGIPKAETRADLNISMSDSRVEVKNITGVSNMLAAARYEIARQAGVLGGGGSVAVETRSFDEASMTTRSSREKETDEEYGFIYEPDLADYNTEVIAAAKPIIAGERANAIAVRYGMSERTLRELVLYDGVALRLLELGVGINPGVCVGVVEGLKKIGRMDIPDGTFRELITAVANGAKPSAELVDALEGGGAKTQKAFVDKEGIDAEIIRLINERKDLAEQCRSDAKKLNFFIGMVIKRCGADPKYVAARAAELINRATGA